MRGVIFATLLVALPAMAAADDKAAVRAAVQQSLDPTVQRRFPGEDDPAAKSGGAAQHWRKRQVGGDTPATPARGMRERAGGAAGDAVSTLANLLMWAVVAVGAGLLLVYAVREFSGEGGGDALPEPEPPARDADHAVVEKPLSDADELARDGRFAEAIHTLLLRTLRELAARSRVAVPRSLTSREILARVDLADEARAALGDLVTTTELSHFGDDEPGAADYDRCRRQFHVFATAWKGRGKAA